MHPHFKNVSIAVIFLIGIGGVWMLLKLAPPRDTASDDTVGVDALKWWREHQTTGSNEPLMKIAEYCAYDVKVTKCLHEHGREHGYVRYADGSGIEQKVAVNW